MTHGYIEAATHAAGGNRTGGGTPAAWPRVSAVQYFPDLAVRQHFPDVRARQHFPDVRVRQHFPDVAVRQHFPDVAVRQHFPGVRVRFAPGSSAYSVEAGPASRPELGD
jgi:hypothetical protein